MNSIINKLLIFGFVFSISLDISAQTENPVIAAIQKELERSKAELKLQGMAPLFFISYSVVDMYTYSMSASLGSISSYNENHTRRGIPMLLTGDYHRNNLNFAGLPVSMLATTSLFDNNTGVPITIWRSLDNMYKNASEQFKNKMATLQQQTQTKEEQDLPDFQQVSPVNMVLNPIPVKFDKPYWENYLRKVSEAAKQFPEILNSSLQLNVKSATSFTYNTEGSRYAVPYSYYQLTFTASTRAVDGQDLSCSVYDENATFEQMLNAETFINRCKVMMEDLIKLSNAPVIDDAYSGPVLFEGVAVERVFRQGFLNNNRLVAAPKTITPFAAQGGNDFEMMLNKKVISRSITIKSITGQEFYKGQRLNGYYPIDAEGVVPDKELTLIENGVLRNMLNGRRPTKKIQSSNGHSKFDYTSSFAPRVMPGNILITSNQTFSNDELRKKLIEAAKEEDLEFAYIVRKYDFWQQMNFLYKVYVADGREELVRGAIISDVSTKSFKRLLGASDKEEMLSYGDTQITIIYPGALLFEELDITRAQNIDFKKPYIVPKPM